MNISEAEVAAGPTDECLDGHEIPMQQKLDGADIRRCKVEAQGV